MKMLITGGSSPRTHSRVDLPTQQALNRPCRAPQTDGLLTVEEDVLFEWSKSISPNFAESKKTQSSAERERSENHLPELIGDVTVDVLSQGTSSGLSVSSSLFGRRGSLGDISSRTTSRCESVPLNTCPTRAFSPYRSQTAPPGNFDDHDVDINVSAKDIMSVAAAHGINSIERSKSCGLYGGQIRDRAPGQQTKSARRARRPSEALYLQTKYKERPCSRAESFVNEELADTVTDLSRECCDVLGPRHCYDCYKISQRNDSVHRNNSAFPSIHMSPTNISTITLVQRLFPELSTMDVLEGMADGYISSRSFSRDILSDMVQRKQEAAIKTVAEKKWKVLKRRISAFSVPDKQGFFTSFTDLRAQIIAQRGSRTGMKGVLFPLKQPQQVLPPAEVEIVLKKEEDRENPANYFGPPLMTREEIQRQKSQPRFYAGADQEYKLPEPPPMTEILHKSNKAIRDMDVGSFVNTGNHKSQGSHVERVRDHKSSHERKSLGKISDSDGISGKSRVGMQPRRLARPTIGGAFCRKSVNSSSFSRPLQMETLNEDGSQSEKEDILEEETGEEEEEKQVKRNSRVNKVNRIQAIRGNNVITEEDQEEEEDDEENMTRTLLEEIEDVDEEQDGDGLVESDDESDAIISSDENDDGVNSTK